MTSHRRQFVQQVDAYLDNALTDAERAAFEQQLQEDGQLQEVVQQQQQIAAALQRAFAPPALPEWAREDRLVAQQPQHNGVMRGPSAPSRAMPIPATSSDTGHGAGRMTLSWPRRLAMAAAILLAVLGGWMIWQVAAPSQSGYEIGPWQPPQQIFAEMDEPDWVCESDAEFVSTFRSRLGQPLLLKEPENGPTMAGLAYRHSITRNTICVLGSANDEKIVVFVDRIERDNGLEVPPNSELNVFRRAVGNLVLYEVSRLDQPKLLDLFHRPDSSSRQVN